MLEEINNELRSVEGEIEFDIEGAMYDVDDFKYAYLSVDEDNEISLVVFAWIGKQITGSWLQIIIREIRIDTYYILAQSVLHFWLSIELNAMIW